MTLAARTTPTTYLIDGTPYPRVTTILGLVRDFSSIPLDVLDHAAERGTAVHRACWILEADPSGLAWSSLHPEIVPYVKAFQQAKRALGWQAVGAEQLVVSRRYGYAGTADLLVTGIGGSHLTILDLKTGMPHPSHALQVAAYAEAYREQTTTRRTIGRSILYLTASGAYRLVVVPPADHTNDFSTFLACLTVHRWQAQHGGTV